MSIDYKELIGLIAGTLTTYAYWPQVRDVWKLKPRPAFQISQRMYVHMFGGILLWLVYSFLTHTVAVMVANTVSLFLVGAVLFYKRKYG